MPVSFFFALKLYIQTGFASPPAGCGAAEIVLQKGAQVRFIVDIHFEARFSANQNLCARVFGFGNVLFEASWSKV